MTAGKGEIGATVLGYEPHGESADPVEHLSEGTVLGRGRYRIVDKIGEGAMATVYEAVDLATASPVALKILTGRHRTRADAEQRLVHEAQYAGQLPDHPNLVRPLAVGRLPELFDRPFVAMELAKGPLLAMVIIFETPMTVARVCTLVGDVVRALADLHARGIIHRDVKPTNIIVTGDADGGPNGSSNGQVAKLLDFGLATIVGDARTAMHDLTSIHDRPGTKRYMAPEQAAGVSPTPAFDVYAVGVTLHEALLGVTPWHDRSEDEVVLRKTDPEQPPFTMAGVRTDVPDGLRELVDRCLAREPASRPTAAEVARTLDAVLAELRSPALDERPHAIERVQTAPRGVEPLSAAVAAAVAAPVAAAPAMRVAPQVSVDDDAPPREAIVESRLAADPRVIVRVETPTRSAKVEAPAPQPTRSRAWIGIALAAIAVVGVGAWWLVTRQGDDASSDSPSAASVAAEPLTPSTAHEDTKAAPPEPNATTSPPAPRIDPTESSPVAERPSTPGVAERPAPAPRPRRDPPTPPTSVPAWQTEQCVEQRRQAEQAMRKNDHEVALELLGERACWQDKAAHRKLRVTALANTRRFSQCVAAGQGSKDPEIQAFVELCTSKASKP